MNTMNGGAAKAAAKNPTAKPKTIWDDALRFAASGVPVFPLHAGCEKLCGKAECAGICKNAKKPLVSGGFKAATTDPETIEGWRQKWPGAMIGVPTGAASGFAVVDLDMKNGKNGEVAFDDYLAEHGEEWPETVEVETPTGGRHLIFRHVAGSVCKTGVLPGVDTRGDGGYVVFAPSKLGDGRKYKVVNAVKPAEMSPAIAALFRKGKPNNSTAPEATPRNALAAPRQKTELDSHYAAAALRHEANAVRTTAPGTRNARLNTAAMKVGHYVPHLISRAEVEAELTAAALDAGLDGEEVARAIANGLAVGMDEPAWPSPTISPATAGEDFSTPEAVAGLETWAESIGTTVASLEQEALAFAAKRLEAKGRELAAYRAAEPKTLAELLAGGLAALEPRRWVVKNLFMLGALTVVGGAGGTGKSSLMNATALSVASGLPFLGFDLRNPNGEPVLILNGDDDEAEISRRLGAMVQHYSIPATALGRVHVIGADALGGLKACEVKDRKIVFNEEWFAWFAGIVRQTGARFAVVDPLFALASLDENDNGMMGAFAGRLNRLAAELGIALVLVVHANKAGIAQSAQNGGDRGANSIAGARRLIDAARAAFVIDALGEKDGTHVGMADTDPRLKQMLGLWSVKGNYVARGAARAYFTMQAVCLHNSRGLDDADMVGVPVPYSVPKVAATDTLLLTILELIEAGKPNVGPYSRTRVGNSDRCILPAIAGAVDWEAEGLEGAPSEKALKDILETRVLGPKLAEEEVVDILLPSGARKGKGIVLTAAGRAELSRLKAEGVENPLG